MRGHDAEGAKGAQKPQKIPKRVLIWFGLIWFLRFTVPTSHSRVAPAPTASFPRWRESTAASKSSKPSKTTDNQHSCALQPENGSQPAWELVAGVLVCLGLGFALRLALAPLRFTAPTRHSCAGGNPQRQPNQAKPPQPAFMRLARHKCSARRINTGFKPFQSFSCPNNALATLTLTTGAKPQAFLHCYKLPYSHPQTKAKNTPSAKQKSRKAAKHGKRKHRLAHSQAQ